MFVFDALYLELRKCIGKPVRFFLSALGNAMTLIRQSLGKAWNEKGENEAGFPNGSRLNA